MLRKYVIIDYIKNDYYYCYDDIELGFSLDRILDNYYRYELPINVYSYNNGKVYVIR